MTLIPEFSGNIQLIYFYETKSSKILRRFAAGTGALAAGLPALAKVKTDEEDNIAPSPANDVQQFNMCGYAAPKIETVRVGVIG